jgi:hypothetical protein
MRCARSFCELQWIGPRFVEGNVSFPQKYLRPIVMPGLPMDYGLMAGLMVRSFKDPVRFRNGVYPENQRETAPVGEYLKALWDPRSEALILYVILSKSRCLPKSVTLPFRFCVLQEANAA